MSGTSRSSAARRMRIAQILGLCMVALAAGAVVFTPAVPEGPTNLPDNPEGSAPDPTTGNTTQTGSTPVGIDSSTAGPGLDGAGGVKPDVVKTDDPGPEPTTPPPTEIADGWTYLGSVIEPRTSFAFVSVNGSQRMIRLGQFIADLDTTVLSITPERIEIERSGVRERIDRAEPLGALVSVNEPSPGTAATIISPGSPESLDARVLNREELRNNPDLDKRRAEFLRRQRERQEQER